MITARSSTKEGSILYKYKSRSSSSKGSSIEILLAILIGVF